MQNIFCDPSLTRSIRAILSKTSADNVPTCFCFFAITHFKLFTRLEFNKRLTYSCTFEAAYKCHKIEYTTRGRQRHHQQTFDLMDKNFCQKKWAVYFLFTNWKERTQRSACIYHCMCIFCTFHWRRLYEFLQFSQSSPDSIFTPRKPTAPWQGQENMK